MGRQKELKSSVQCTCRKGYVGMMGSEAKETGLPVEAQSQRALLVKLRSLGLIIWSLKDSTHLIWPDSPLRPITPPAVRRMHWKEMKLETKRSISEALHWSKR